MNSKVRTRLFLAVATLASAAAHATTLKHVTMVDLLRESDLIAETDVVGIEYRTSDIAGPEHVSLPHTFVTFRVRRVLRGTGTEGDVITLRFVGGPLLGRPLVLLVSGVPAFRPGDRDVLFIRENGKSQCPLVGWQQGRIRVVRGEVFGDLGCELWVAPDGNLIRGRTGIDIRSESYPPVAHSESDPEFTAAGREAAFTPPQGALRPDANGLIAIANGMIGQLEARGELAPPQSFASANIGETFHFLAPVAVPPPVDPVPVEKSRDDSDPREPLPRRSRSEKE